MLSFQLDSVKNDFLKYLDSLGLAPKSHKNYRSDLSHFIAWLITKIRSFGSYTETLTESIPFLNLNMASEYKNHMLENQISSKTINRRLSTVRHLSRFLVSSQILDFDFTEGVQNLSSAKAKRIPVSPLVSDFRSYLESEKVSPNTIKNYLSDIRQFLLWLEQKDLRSTIQDLRK